MSMFSLVLVGFGLAPLGLLLLFWNMFPQDRGIHPIYRGSGVETLDKEPGSKTRHRRAKRERLSINAGGVSAKTRR